MLMDWLRTLLIAAGGAVVIIAIWFGRIPVVRRARRGSNGAPTMGWWFSFWVAVVLAAFLANRLPDGF
jgi:hypothetical protein